MAGINLVPMSTGLQADGSPDAALLQALAARRRGAAMSAGQQLTATAADTSQPIYHKGVGYAKLLAGALGGWMQGNEAQAKLDAAKAGATSTAKLAQSWGMSPEQAAQLQGLMLTNPEQANAIVKQMAERAYAKPDRSFGVIGKDIMGREKYGFIDNGTQTITSPGAPAAAGGGLPAAPAAPGRAAAPRAVAPPPDPNAIRNAPGAPGTAGVATGEDPITRQQMTAAGYPQNAPLPPAGVDPKTYFEEWSKSQTARDLPADSAAVSSLRKEVQGLPSYKNMAQAAPIYRAMAETAGRDNKASDLNLIYGLGKIMDPGSVVREGEMIMANNTQGWADKLNGYIKGIQGGALLTPETRQQLMAEAHGRMQAYNQMYVQDAQQYRGIVERNQINPADVIPDFGTFEPWKAPEQQGPPIPADLQQQRAAAGAVSGGQPAPAGAPSQPSLADIEAEILRRQQQAQPPQPQPERYYDPMGNTF